MGQTDARSRAGRLVLGLAGGGANDQESAQRLGDL